MQKGNLVKILLILLVVSAGVVGAAYYFYKDTNTNGKSQIESQYMVKNYLSDNISALSPEKEVLGGKFFITNYEFTSPTRVVVEYEDGHVAYRASVIFTIENDEVIVHKFSMTPEENPMVGNDNMLALELAELIADKYDKNVEEVTITVEKQTATHANGRVKLFPKDQPGNAGRFLAAQVDGEWIIVVDGNGLPTCFETDRYSFPADILPGCINEEGVLRMNQWDLIVDSIIDCKVKEIMQTHSLYVTAKLKDGSLLEGVEPQIDEIIDLAISTQDKCGEILMATE